jgi:hypothetical protein
MTMGCNLIDYLGEVSTKTADFTTAKCLWNSPFSTPGARRMCMDVKNSYLNTSMDRPECSM